MSDIQTSWQKVQETIHALVAERDRLKDHIEGLRENRDAFVQETHRLEEECDRLKAEVETRSEEVFRVHKDRYAWKAKYDELDNENKSIVDRMESQTKVINNLKAKAEKMATLLLAATKRIDPNSSFAHPFLEQAKAALDGNCDLCEGFYKCKEHEEV